MSDGLRDRMRRADPAASLPPLPPEETRRLLRNIGNTLRNVEVPRQRRLPVLVGAAALAAVTVGVVLAVGGDHDGTPGRVVAVPTTTTRPAPTTNAPAPGTNAPSPTTSSVPAASSATPPATSPSTPESRKTTVVALRDDAADPGVRCPRPDAAFLAERARLAFEGTVLRVEGRQVTLEVGRVWTGEQADLAEVRNSGTDPALLAGFEPRVGQTYLVAAAEQQVMGCGYSGPAQDDLRAVYDEAFPRR